MIKIKITNIKKKTKKLIFFLKKIKEKNFRINKSFKNTPWIHFNNPNFNFYKFELNNEIFGLAVLIKMKLNFHLQFLYIGKNFRSMGYGKKILDELLPKRKFTTVHVPYRLTSRTQKFYAKNGFRLSNLREKNFKLMYWIKRCKKYDKKTFKEKKLMYRNLN